MTIESPASTPVHAIQILRLADVCKVTGLGKSIIYQLESQRQFPNRVRLTSHAVGWVDAEVREWLSERMRHRRSPLRTDKN